jgi:hypothetical protein
MNKIDLIIECMEQILNDELPSPENMMKAFRYACELRELQPVGVFEYDWMNKVWEELTPNCEGVKLYALDEVTK